MIGEDMQNYNDNVLVCVACAKILGDSPVIIDEFDQIFCSDSCFGDWADVCACTRSPENMFEDYLFNVKVEPKNIRRYFMEELQTRIVVTSKLMFLASNFELETKKISEVIGEENKGDKNDIRKRTRTGSI
jgi:hypothetical protein